MVDRRALTLTSLMVACALSIEDGPDDGTVADTSVSDSAQGSCGLPSQAEDPAWGAFIDEFVGAGLDRYAAQGLCFDAVVVDARVPGAVFDATTNTLWVDARHDGDPEDFVRRLEEEMAVATAIQAGLLGAVVDGRWPERRSIRLEEAAPDEWPYQPERAFVGAYARSTDVARWSFHALLEACAHLPSVEPRWLESARALDAYLGLAPPPQGILEPFLSRFEPAGALELPEVYGDPSREIRAALAEESHYLLVRQSPYIDLAFDLRSGTYDEQGIPSEGALPRSAGWFLSEELDPHDLWNDLSSFADASGRRVAPLALRGWGDSDPVPTVLAFEGADGGIRWLDRCATSEAYEWVALTGYDFWQGTFGYTDGEVWHLSRWGRQVEWFRWITESQPDPP